VRADPQGGGGHIVQPAGDGRAASSPVMEAACGVTWPTIWADPLTGGKASLNASRP